LNKNRFRYIPLHNRYIPALLIIALFALLSYTNVRELTASMNNDGKIINISGKQRMLSQKLVLLSMKYIENPLVANKIELEKNILLMKTSHSYLSKYIYNDRLKEIYFTMGLDKKIKNYLNSFKKIIKSQDKKTLYEVHIKAEKLLPLLSLVVKEYEVISNSKVDTLKQKQLFILLLTLLFLTLEVIFIFIPASSNIKENIIKAKQRLKDELDQKEYFDIVIESNNNAIIAIDSTYTILTYNKKAEEIFGFLKDEMIGSRNLLNIIPQKYHDMHNSRSLAYFESGVSGNIINKTVEVEAIRKDGTIFPISISMGASISNGIVIANISDITELKKQEIALLQQSRLAQMGEMISMIAHQWRQPLTAISATTNNLSLKLLLGEIDTAEFTKELDLIADYSQHLSHTIDDFRGFFKDDKEKEITTLDEIANSTLGILKLSIENQNIKIITNLDCNKELTTYANELKQVVLNLIKNAQDILLEKNIENPTITISSTFKNNTHILIVQDNAGGVPDDIIGEIFDPYFSTKKEKDGTGLGLYMSKTIIEEHCGGKLSVSNDKDGAVFLVALPLSVEKIELEKE